jgi:hypothetical protein
MSFTNLVHDVITLEHLLAPVSVSIATGSFIDPKSKWY